MQVQSQIPDIVRQYGLSEADYSIDRVGSGYIHYTFKLSGEQSYILQRVNKNVFTKPEIIASNLRHASDYLRAKYPDYLFLTPIRSLAGDEMVYDSEGFPWRIFPFIENTFTVDKVSTTDEAFSAAATFARLTKYLEGIDIGLFKPTIDRFHDLQWRWEQFEASLQQASSERLKIAEKEIQQSHNFNYLVKEYTRLITSGVLQVRITHNDTKINNVLFDSATERATCAIDLDTLMPGYFIYDLGDMVRTFVSPVDEEEKDLSKIVVRKNIHGAVIDGYLSQMGSTLNGDEKKTIPFSGMMMTYIMALRMLTDYLNGDIYYQIRYADQNLVRAKNQLRLLEELKKHAG